MFDHVNHSQHTAIRVEQQPNDAADAARLYGEIKKKAEEDIIKSVRVDSNEFKGVLQMTKQAATYETHLKMVYSLNGKKMTTSYTHEPDYRQNLSEEEQKAAMVKGLMEDMAKQIAGEILWDALQPLIKNRII